MPNLLMKANTFAERLKVSSPPIFQAPMAGGITTPALVAGAANNGAVGSFATGYLTTEQVKNGISSIKKLTDKPFCVNLFIPNHAKVDLKKLQQYQQALNKYRRELNLPEVEDLPQNLTNKDNFHDIVDIILSEKIPMVSFTFGLLPEDALLKLKKANVLLFGTANTLSEAKKLAEQQVDAVIAQGYEAGGHRGGFFSPPKLAEIGSMALIPLLVDKMGHIPIIAAGGIMNGRSIAAALCLGAAGAQIGTALLRTEESGANKIYQDELIKNHEENKAVLTDKFTGKLARALENTFITNFEKEFPYKPPYPITHELTSPIRKEAAKQNRPDLMSLWAGQGYQSINQQNLPIAELIRQWRTELNALLENTDVSQKLKIRK